MFSKLKGEKGAEGQPILEVNYKKTRDQEYSCSSIFIYSHSALNQLISLVRIWLTSLSLETWVYLSTSGRRAHFQKE